MESIIQKRIEELEAKREKFIVQANLEVAAYNGAIQELRRLLESLTPQPTMEPLAQASTSSAQDPRLSTIVTPSGNGNSMYGSPE